MLIFAKDKHSVALYIYNTARVMYSGNGKLVVESRRGGRREKQFGRIRIYCREYRKDALVLGTIGRNGIFKL